MKLLWSGTWVTGSVTVKDTAYYNLFVITLAGANEAIFAYKTGSQINGIGGCSWGIDVDGGYPSDTQTAVSGFRASYSGNIWTLVGLVRVNTGNNYIYKLSGVGRIYGLL